MNTSSNCFRTHFEVSVVLLSVLPSQKKKKKKDYFSLRH